MRRSEMERPPRGAGCRAALASGGRLESVGDLLWPGKGREPWYPLPRAEPLVGAVRVGQLPG